MNPNNIYIICIKDLTSNKWRQVLSCYLKVKFYTQFEEKIIVLNPSTYVCTKSKYKCICFKYIYVTRI